eukprot:GHVL01043002.1.p1 GENE.GHVL01043002.1~~GHVL01043002.1.p1  ORF type:complete len:103 (-),score=23.80 GHVL01043002.1:41-349(-)
MKPYEERKGYGYCWSVDPIDGTKEFIKRSDEFTVNIGLCDPSGTPVLGVVIIPPSKTEYFAVKTHGAWKRSNSCTTPNRIRVKKFNESDDGKRAYIYIYIYS